ncbi:MAG: chorismate mutase [Lachnospiraceae bacterium]|jgi:chorismate mutase|nr:chorismate mutase [Lachnospiraceae bacterium]
MTLDEIRIRIDQTDTQMKPLFLSRMECAGQVAETKKQNGGEVFVASREQAILDARTADVNPEIRGEYTAFLRHLIGLSRRYQYGILTDMQEKSVAEALSRAGLDPKTPHNQVEVRFTCGKENAGLPVLMEAISLNGIPIRRLLMEASDGPQTVTLLLEGSLKKPHMKQLLCQLIKETADFQIVALEE